ncbi:hypothetical protein DB32_001267 [Sandaracinus amylolyticus]|uniref:Uncharacterized protein n=1 Tax=Sandaracinus amylolyticus TaxID=927083 RepID=A0A0F6W068_9BACT|nr:hypothetical protein DB32_001267 [Sandaracinus amylolyticus]
MEREHCDHEAGDRRDAVHGTSDESLDATADAGAPIASARAGVR